MSDNNDKNESNVNNNIDSNKTNNNSQTIIRQGMVLVVASLIVRFIGFLYRIPLTNMIGDVGNGIYSASFNIYTFFLLISSAAMPSVIGKLVSERLAKNEYKNAHKVFIYSMIISCVLGGASALLLFFEASWFEAFTRTPGTYASIKVLAPTVFVVSILAVFRGYFQGMKTTVPTAYSQVVEQIMNAIFSLVCAYVLVKISIPLGAAGGTMGTLAGAASGLLVIVIIYLKNRKRILNNVESDDTTSVDKGTTLVIEILTTALPIVIGTTIFSITSIIDMRMSIQRLVESGSYSSVDAVALYGQLSGKYTVIANLPISLATAFASVMIPNLASMRTQGATDEIKGKINSSIKFVMIFSIPASVGIGILGKEILYFLYPSYPDGYYLLYFGAINIIAISFNQILTGTLQGLGKMYLPILSALVGITFKILVNYNLIVIPSINIIGAVISTFVCYFIASQLNYRHLKKAINFNLDIKNCLLKPALSASIMGVICFFTNKLVFTLTNSSNIGLIVSMVVSIVVYGVLTLYSKCLTKEELSSIPVIKKYAHKF